MSLSALETVWATRGIDASTLVMRRDGTLVASERRRIAESATLASDPGESIPPREILSPQRLAMGELLGRGGMGEVRAAEQLGLRRPVAVKTVLDRGDRAQAAALLKEAWVGATLEHPSVVPVHTLASTEAGPAIVMKRIEGRSWAEALAARGEGEAEPSEADLRTFARVCHAIAFAHSRGILHLDLKPENVMLGSHGEVYVLDWGLAVAHGPEGPAWLPAARSIANVAGTPGFMAPELVVADGARIGPRTDVYLLGALLHFLITGRVLHEGTSLVEVLLHAYESPPPRYGGAVPEGLAAIVARATHADPEQRFASAERLREAVEAHLRDRRADRLAREMRERLAELDALFAQAGVGDAEIEPRITELELALEQIRRSSPEHAALGTLEDVLLERRALQALRAERADAAERFLRGLRSPPAELTQRLAALRASLAARERHVERLEEMRRELDRTLGDDTRRHVFLLFGALWAIVCLAFGALTRAGAIALGYRELLVEGALICCLLVPLAIVGRDSFFVNRANRRLWGGLIVTACTVQLFWVVGAMLAIPVSAAIAATLFFYLYAFVTLGFVFDVRMARAAPPLAIAAAAAAIWPDFVHDAVGLGGGGAVAAILWKRRSRAIG